MFYVYTQLFDVYSAGDDLTGSKHVAVLNF